jgi:hypothetical protein
VLKLKSRVLEKEIKLCVLGTVPVPCFLQVIFLEVVVYSGVKRSKKF